MPKPFVSLCLAWCIFWTIFITVSIINSTSGGTGLDWWCLIINSFGVGVFVVLLVQKD